MNTPTLSHALHVIFGAGPLGQSVRVDHATPHRTTIKQTVVWYRAHVGSGQ